MKQALIASLACLVATSGAFAAGTGAMAGKLTANEVQKSTKKQAETLSQEMLEACAHGEKVVTVVSRTEPRFFAGRMVPQRVEFKKTVCN